MDPFSADEFSTVAGILRRERGGPSFTIDGNLLQWQNWSLVIGFNYREGMTLHTARYQDGDSRWSSAATASARSATSTPRCTTAR